MKNIMILFVMIALIGAVFSHEGGDPIEEGKILVQSKASCDNLGNEELEDIGEYLMEQMHPGEAHKLMHQMMGFKEGDPAEAQFHINLARSIYCENNGRTGMMGLRTMMNSGMFAGGMMGGYGLFGWDVVNLLMIALLAGVVGLIYLHIWNKVTDKEKK